MGTSDTAQRSTRSPSRKVKKSATHRIKVFMNVTAILDEMKTFLWMLFDRRYHMGWLTRLITIGLVVFILLSHFIWPFARWDMVISPVWDKLIDLVLGLILFMFLHFEMRRYKEWRGQR